MPAPKSDAPQCRPGLSTYLVKPFRIIGERARNRTWNLLIKSQLLCQLSYAPVALTFPIFIPHHCAVCERAGHPAGNQPGVNTTL